MEEIAAACRERIVKTIAEKPKEVVEYLKRVVEKLRSTVSLYKIVLFGSYAKGTAKPDSDIDLMVILDSDYFSKNGSEKLKRDCKVIRLLSDIHYEYGMDFKVYSKSELQELKDRENLFIEEVEQTGETLYEKKH